MGVLFASQIILFENQRITVIRSYPMAVDRVKKYFLSTLFGKMENLTAFLGIT
jgi:hypothetical protein